MAGASNTAIGRAKHLRETFSEAKSTDRMRRLLQALVHRVTVAPTSTELRIDKPAAIGLLLGTEDAAPTHGKRSGRTVVRSPTGRARPSAPATTNRERDPAPGSDGERDVGSEATSEPEAPELHTIVLPMTMRRRGFERRLVIDGQEAASARPDRPLIEMIARAHLYLQATTVEGLDRREVAARYDTRPEDVGRILPLAFLSPLITDAILAGHQPSDLSVIRMARQTDLPARWTEQVETLGF